MFSSLWNVLAYGFHCSYVRIRDGLFSVQWHFFTAVYSNNFSSVRSHLECTFLIYYRLRKVKLLIRPSFMAFCCAKRLGLFTCGGKIDSWHRGYGFKCYSLYLTTTKMAVVVTWELTKLSLDLEVIAFHNTLNLTWSWKNEENDVPQQSWLRLPMVAALTGWMN